MSGKSKQSGLSDRQEKAKRGKNTFLGYGVRAGKISSPASIITGKNLRRNSAKPSTPPKAKPAK